ncbi:glycoside hydrolase family 43 protein [Alginatibacterium sediminis]|uniref:Glycoside hydrolase family 43 protein n=1 Tax=Alginatibacterium sediminis TaxID=2164068 RepID=A0A420E7W6_9ALTE|nr:glycoside hydrolase family 43 protein [Alginatibacterium sediminis]RKF15566.1 glycoside hydrolase family 43 protein [Alginatibacterium sediminis]
MNTIENPIIPGFNPDPSIVRVGDDYYIATSTFEWFPGVQIHQSRDLVHWKLCTHALVDQQHLNMLGMDNSEGVYAPALSYSDGQFWLCFSNVHSCRGGSWMATPCFVVSAPSISGPWSLPVSIGNYGFDPSLFHDDDGKKYMLNMLWDGRQGKNKFGGIVLQEFDVSTGKLCGPVKTIFTGTKLGCTEGPQILKKDNFYYLVTAEGGTSLDHAVTVCRSHSIWGPYELHPQNPILSSRFQEDAPLQRAGHGFFVKTQGGQWYMTHLCSRQIRDPEQGLYGPKYGNGRSILGRESAIQAIEWRDDWPWLKGGGTVPFEQVKGPDLPTHIWPARPNRDDFDQPQLDINFASLREAVNPSWLSLTERPGYLRLKGRQYLYSRYQQSLIARRWQSFNASAQTAIEFKPTHFMQMAGLVVYYSRKDHYFLKQTLSDEGETALQICQFIGGKYDEHELVLLPSCERIHLKVDLKQQWYQFSYSLDSNYWVAIGPRLNSTALSDEAGNDVFRFTGSFVGLFACDLTGQNLHADFDYFEYLQEP